MKKISFALIKTLREKGWLRTEGFSLRKGFAGVFEVLKVRVFTSQDAKDNKQDNFTLECKAPNGVANLSAYQIANARIIKDEIKADPVMEKDGIFFEDDLAVVIGNSVRFHTKFEDNIDFAFEDELNVVGASVIKGEDGNPLIPLRRYKYYNQILKHHRSELGDVGAFVTRQDFKDYLASDTTVIPGVPSGITEMQLNCGLKANDESLWSFTLLVKDKAEA